MVRALAATILLLSIALRETRTELMPFLPRQAQRPLWVVTSIVLLVLTVPWGFTSRSTSVWFGLPPWAFYSLFASVVFALVVAVAVRVAWPEAPAVNDSPESSPEAESEPV